MTMIKCRECGIDISDTAMTCVGCGAPLAVSMRFGDFNGDGKVDFNDFKAACGKLKEKAVSTLEGARNLSKQAMKSTAEKDAEDVNVLVQQFGDQQAMDKTASQMNCDKYKAALESTIDLKFAEVMRSKTDPEKFLTYADAQILTASVRNIFKTALSFTPPQLEAACRLSEAILAPSAQERQNLIKAAIGLAGGTAGIGMVIGGVGAALGWGAGIVATVTAAFVGTSFAGPAGWIIAGVSLAAIAGYFATTSNKQTDTERFMNVLKTATARAVDAIWGQYEAELSKAIVTDEKPSEGP